MSSDQALKKLRCARQPREARLDPLALARPAAKSAAQGLGEIVGAVPGQRVDEKRRLRPDPARLRLIGPSRRRSAMISLCTAKCSGSGISTTTTTTTTPDR